MSIDNLITRPTRTPMIAASVLSADFAQMGAEARSALEAGADLLHFDVMDGHFVENLTMGPSLCRSLRRTLPEAFFDVHLMVSDPAKFVDSFAEAGANHITFHIEAVPDPIALAVTIHSAGMTAGLAINPPTGVSRLMDFVEHVDLVLVMSVNPGFSGQDFMPAVLQKAQGIRPLLRADQRLEMDGGINAQTVPAARDAGCDILVAASAIFNAADYAAAITALRSPGGILTGRR
ncbi:MAG: ribulose-phosphate 3-epimerase [Planctomycetes bacterium]|nr:ribulose-phosphate 3-epimerase [Planctomycetota bacterium]